MRANKNTSVCVATSPRPLIQIDANHTGQKPTGSLNRAARTSYVRLRRRTRRRNADGQRAGTPVRRQAELLQAWAIVPQQLANFAPPRPQPAGEPDPEQARALAGAHGGRAVLAVCSDPDCTRLGQIIQANLACVGMRIQLRPYAGAIASGVSNCGQPPLYRYPGPSTDSARRPWCCQHRLGIRSARQPGYAGHNGGAL